MIVKAFKMYHHKAEVESAETHGQCWHGDTSEKLRRKGFDVTGIDPVERILTEPSYGSKVLMGKWLSERNQYEGISEAR